VHLVLYFAVTAALTAFGGDAMALIST
jgi:hypothetical protein